MERAIIHLLTFLDIPIARMRLGEVVIGIKVDAGLAHLTIIIHVERVRHVVGGFFHIVGFEMVIEVAIGHHVSHKAACTLIIETHVAVILETHRVLVIEHVIGTQNEAQYVVITLTAPAIVLMPNGVGSDILGNAVLLQPAVLKVADGAKDI